MTTAHPPLDMITAHATGAASAGVSLLVATHLTFCSRCRARVADLESLAGALFAASAPVEMSPGALDAVMARLDDAPAPRRAAPEAAPGLPRPIREAVGAPIEGLRWRRRIPGVSEIAVPLAGEERVSLLRVRPGFGVPAHTHTAVEATLVLSGELHDRGVVYRVGDVCVATEEDDHHPKAGPGEDCVCLTVLAGGVRFTGTFGRALNLFAE